MWQNPFPNQSFALCAADGTVLAELPPTTHFESAIGRPQRPDPLTPRTNAPPGGVAAGTRTTTVQEVRTIDPYTWERAPFSNVWFPLGDGLPKERPPAPSTVTTTTTDENSTVTEEVTQTVTLAGTQQTTTTTTVKTTAPTAGAVKRYAATAPYWGSAPPSPLLQTDSIQAAYEAAYAYAMQGRQEGWVVEWQAGSNSYTVLDRLERPAPPQIVLTGNWWYRSGDEALIHAAQIERACGAATQLMFRGRTLATFNRDIPNLFQMKTADRMRDVTYTLTLYTTEYFTAQEFMRRQLQ